MFQGQFWKWMIVLPLLLTACQVVRVPITHIQAAEGSIPQDVKNIVIMPYDYAPQLPPDFAFVKDRVPDQIATKILQWKTYGVVERGKLKALMNEAMLQKGSTMSDEEIEEVGRVASAEAIVVGRISLVSVEDQTVTKTFTIQPRQKDPDLPPPQPQQVSYDYVIRKVTLTATSEMLHINTKKKIVTDSFSSTYDSEVDPNVVGDSFTTRDAAYYQNQPGRVPAVSTIIDSLAAECAQQFLKKISAHPEHYLVELKTGDSEAMGSGLDWAEQKQYRRAIEEFTKATSHPKDKAKAWFNIAVCHEAMGNHREALAAYEQSNAIEPSKDAKAGIARIRKYQPSL